MVSPREPTTSYRLPRAPYARACISIFVAGSHLQAWQSHHGHPPLWWAGTDPSVAGIVYIMAFVPETGELDRRSAPERRWPAHPAACQRHPALGQGEVCRLVRWGRSS